MKLANLIVLPLLATLWGCAADANESAVDGTAAVSVETLTAPLMTDAIEANSEMLIGTVDAVNQPSRLAALQEAEGFPRFRVRQLPPTATDEVTLLKDIYPRAYESSVTRLRDGELHVDNYQARWNATMAGDHAANGITERTIVDTFVLLNKAGLAFVLDHVEWRNFAGSLDILRRYEDSVSTLGEVDGYRYDYVRVKSAVAQVIEGMAVERDWIVRMPVGCGDSSCKEYAAAPW